MFKQNKAITLIALIITIIVLLILAGVTINMVLGENGLINKAKTSVGKYENAQERENTILAGYETKIDNARGTITIDEKQYNDLISEIESLKNIEYGDFRKSSVQTPSTGDSITIDRMANGNMRLENNKVYLTEGKTYRMMCNLGVQTATNTHIWYYIINKNNQQISNTALTINNAFNGHDSYYAAAIYTAQKDDYITIYTNYAAENSEINPGSFSLIITEIK